MRSKTQFSGVRRASRPTLVNVCMMYSSFLQVFLPSSSCCQSFPQSTHLSEALAQFRNEHLRLLKRGEVTTFRNLVPVEELRIGLAAPYLRRSKKAPFKNPHPHHHIDAQTAENLAQPPQEHPPRPTRGH